MKMKTKSIRLCTAASVAAGCVLAMLAAPSAQAQTYTVLYSFIGGADGQAPIAGVIQDGDGNLYGTTSGGGASGHGTVFKLSKAGKGTVLYSFTGGPDGGLPGAAVIRDGSGNLYGTTEMGGASNAGTVFKLSKTGKETVLHSFTGGADGAYPVGGVIRDSSGNIYGTAFLGGPSGNGTVFKLTTTGKETVLYTFTGGTDGGQPLAGVIRDAKGNLYGTTQGGGDLTCGAPYGCGTVFKVEAAGKETVLYSFTGGADGRAPLAGVIRDTSGNLYGTTNSGGNLNCLSGGCGTVFKLSSAGKETVLYSFSDGPDGAGPWGVVQDANGNLYGTTAGGGNPSCNCGTVFKLSKTGKETVLYTFSGGADGRAPLAGVIRDTSGNLYGTTAGGGASGHGTVFKLTQ
jgi:uncharacterized repeat protein (TIGR03803 family)